MVNFVYNIATVTGRPGFLLFLLLLLLSILLLLLLLTTTTAADATSTKLKANPALPPPPSKKIYVDHVATNLFFSFAQIDIKVLSAQHEQES